MNPLKAGDIAPKFSLPDQDGEQVNLTDFQGQRVLVYFYPKAMTPGCTVQACGLRDNMDELKKAGVDVLGISTDKPEKLSRFAEKELLNFTLLSDEDHQVCEQFGVWGEKSFMGKTYDGIHRISFLIDADGKIEHVFDDFKTSNHHDVVLNWLKEHFAPFRAGCACGQHTSLLVIKITFSLSPATRVSNPFFAER